MAKVEYRGTGRRKSSVARVRLVTGTGAFTVNGRDLKDYIPSDATILDLMQPLEMTDSVGKFDVIVNVEGGGPTGQAGAIRLGIARALLEVNPDHRATLKPNAMLTRDARVKERKKYGLKAARRAPQFSKR